jgi:hypothetical protein
MRKLHLRPDDVAVETFTIEPEDASRGTVQAHQSGADTCATCVNYLCSASRLQTNCCTQNPDANCSLPAVC